MLSLLRLIPGAGIIVPFVEAFVAGFLKFVSHPVGAAIMGAIVGGWLYGNRIERIERQRCETEKQESIDAARAIDREAAESAQRKMREDLATMVRLREEDNAEDEKQIAELERDIAAGTRSRCIPSQSDIRRLRLK